MALIAMSGIDGAGKSTQLALLVDELERRGRRAELVWHRPGYSRRLDGARALLRRLRPNAIPDAGLSATRDRTFARPGVSAAWLIAAAIDTLIEYGAVVRGHLLRGRVVLCDRYLLDARLDLELRFPNHQRLIDAMFVGLESICPRPDCNLLLVIPEAEMRRRNEGANEPFPDPPQIRAARYRAYLELAGRGHFEVIDADADRQTVHRSIVERLEPVLS